MLSSRNAKKSRIDLVIIESEKCEKCIPLKTDDSLLALFFVVVILPQQV